MMLPDVGRSYFAHTRRVQEYVHCAVLTFVGVLRDVRALCRYKCVYCVEPKRVCVCACVCERILQVCVGVCIMQVCVGVCIILY